MISPSLSVFKTLDAFSRTGLEALPAILDQVLPLNRAQREDLPRAIRELSTRLTTERAALERPYWASPRLASAYVRYFLPWNLVRLTALFPALDLSPLLNQAADPATPEKPPLMLDVGSGPLTLPLALWLSRPDLRSRPLTVLAADSAPRPLGLGKELMEKMMHQLDPDSPWRIRTVRAPLSGVFRHLPHRPRLITLGNALNEWARQQPRRGGSQGLGSAEGRLKALAESLIRALPAQGAVVVVEPGTRLGGKLVAGLRHEVLHSPAPGGQAPLLSAAPCPHQRNCPLLTPQGTSWCHFTTPAGEAPEHLRHLSRKAGLDKESVSLSYMLFHKVPPEGQEADPQKGSSPEVLAARVISDAFPVPGHPGRARYLCTARGVALLPDAARLPSGRLCQVRLLKGRGDPKSGAPLAEVVRPGI